MHLGDFFFDRLVDHVEDSGKELKRSALSEKSEEEEVLPPRMVIPCITNEEVIPGPHQP